MPTTDHIPDFQIQSGGIYSEACLARNISSFSGLCSFVWALPYRRNPDKDNLLTVFTDNCGTCSTKHALLKLVADEHFANGIQLILCLFRMNARNTPKVAQILKNKDIDYIPEAHMYLKYNGYIHDFTGAGFTPSNYENDILEELEIGPGQANRFKVEYHKKYLHNWLILKDSPQISFARLWEARENCIAALAGN